MKWKCKGCGEISLEAELLSAPSPFDETDTLTACPLCKQCSDGFDLLCDEDGCEEPAQCGWPTSHESDHGTEEDRLGCLAEEEPTCNSHPDAPHVFCRQASHGAGRYVCECEGWQPEEKSEWTQTDKINTVRDIMSTEEFDKMVKDAERYRFLRAQHKDPEGDFWVEQHGVLSVAYLDAAIDAAMEKS